MGVITKLAVGAVAAIAIAKSTAKAAPKAKGAAKKVYGKKRSKRAVRS